jgi:hypothetical protein
VRELVGHGDLATTQGYAAVVAGDRGAAVGVLERAFQSARSTVACDGAPPGRMRRLASRITPRTRGLRRLLRRRRSAGNHLETLPSTAE